MTARRLLFDLSSLIRWHGPTVGITRVQQQLARYARQRRDDVVFTVFDPFARRLRAIKSDWIDAVVENQASVEPSLLPDLGRTSWSHRNTRLLGRAYFWATKSRRTLISELERRRLKSRSPAARSAVGNIQLRLMKPQEHTRYHDAQGRRRPCPPLDVIVDRQLAIGGGDVLISTQSDWAHLDMDRIVADKRRCGLRHVILCYDIIPILYPQWYLPHDVECFAAYYERAFAEADRVIFNAASNLRDARTYCRARGFDLADTRIVPLGADFTTVGGDAGALPEGLAADRFALFVSTIEPRKNHRLLFDVWRRLAADGVLARRRFKLVFVGRLGWMMDDFVSVLQADPQYNESVFHFASVSDRELGALYRNAAFCLYPSFYEGFGLPVVEALRHDVPVIGSSGGAIPEVVGDGGVCLDPTDEGAWYTEIRRMIEDAEYRRGWADRAKAHRPVSWDEAGGLFFDAVTEPFAAAGRIAS